MIQRKENGQAQPQTRVFGFLVGVEIEDNTVTAGDIGMLLSDSVRFVEGTGDITVDILGEVDAVEDTPQTGEWAGLDATKGN